MPLSIAILGAGQLGRMLVLAGYTMGLRFRLLDPATNTPTGLMADHIAAPYNDPDALARLAHDVRAITYEFENVPVETASTLEQFAPVYPPPAALAAAQDRLAEKQFFQQLGAATPRFASVNSRAELAAALDICGVPAVLKTRRMGYDGKGQFVIRHPNDVDAAWQALGEQALILESFVNFKRELSIIAVRAPTGQIAFYPLVENHHREGILRTSIAPAPDITQELQTQAEQIARQALDALEYVGVLAIELFEVEKPTTANEQQFNLLGGSLLVVNEMAPRVHNSGHWTIEGAETSQFENHLRAIIGMPLGSTAPRGHSVMLNIIGVLPDTEAVLRIPGAHLHLYDKEPRAGRKLGHITLRDDNHDLLMERVALVQQLIDQSAM
jgi:5-(carboxyamino)imidazole ribonucleotide synthase